MSLAQQHWQSPMPLCDPDLSKTEGHSPPKNYLPSPSLAGSPEQSSHRKRKLGEEESVERPAAKVSRLASPKTTSTSKVGSDSEHLNPILTWVQTGHWPRGFTGCWPRGLTGCWPRGLPGGCLAMMSEPLSSESSKRKNNAVHRSELKRQRPLRGVFMEQSQKVCHESVDMCDGFLEPSHQLVSCTLYPESALLEALTRAHVLNETRIQRDVMPRLVPPAEILRFHGEAIPDCICEELNALWQYCEPKAGTIPKPDYTAGLFVDAFSAEEIEELQMYSSPTRPFLFTPDLCFAFLTCEAKGGDQALGRARSQNINNGSVAVSAIIELYKAAFGQTQPQRVAELYGKVLAFSVSHDPEIVTIWGHYAVMDNADQKEKFYYHNIDTFSLAVRNAVHKDRAYHFVRNVYDRFVPEHLERIKAAVASLLSRSNRMGVLLSAASDSSVGNLSSQPDSQPGTFRIPGLPASMARESDQSVQGGGKGGHSKKEQQINNLLQHIELQQEKLEQQRKDLEQQRKESNEQLGKMMEIISNLQPGLNLAPKV